MESDGIWWEVIVIGVAMLLYGICDGTEVALLTAQKRRLQEWKDRGKRGAAVAIQLRDMPHRALTTLRIIMTGVGVLAAVVAGILAVHDIAPWVRARWVVPGVHWWSTPLALGVTIGVLTYVTLVVGQILPRAIALQHAEAVLCRVARPLLGVTNVLGVLRALLTASATVFLWVMRQPQPPELVAVTTITEEDVTTMVREGAERGIFEEVEHELIEGVFEFTDTAVREIMVPRVHMQALELSTPPQDVLHKMGDIGHSRVPVYSGDLDHVVGVLYFKDLLRALSEERPWTLHSLLHPPLFVPETVQISQLLRMLQQRRLNMAMVVDEHGGVAGMVTIEDLLEQLVGDIADEDEPEPDAQVVQLPDGALAIQGSMPLWDLRERYGLPVQECSDYQTLAGFLLARLGRVPQGGEAVIEQGYRFTVVDMDGPRIVRIKVEHYAMEDRESPMADPLPTQSAAQDTPKAM
jgi:putative hemolysin